MAIIEYSDASSESDSDCEDFPGPEFVMYRDREYWKDVKPIKLAEYDTISNLVYSDTYDYFRAVVANQECSMRAFNLTEDCVKLNANNYTVWHYRRILLQELNIDLKNELNMINNLILKIRKNYQVWEHQKFVLKLMKKRIENYNSEIVHSIKKFFHKVLSKKVDGNEKDWKNYHVWQQRQWFIQEWDQFDNELDYTELMLDIDVRNNSAWNHRYFVISNTDNGFEECIINRECKFTIEKLKMVPHNESAWNYLLGVIKKSKFDLNSFSWILDICKKIDDNNNPYLNYFLLKMACLKLDAMVKDEQIDNFKKLANEAKTCCQKLANIDTIRQNYWTFKMNELNEFYQC